ncbi:helix-turn-helix transcriptional regulator [Terriglobus sp. ADX1]
MGAMKEKEATLIAKALGEPSRFSIYSQIAEGDGIYCGEVCNKHALSPGTVSHHLKVLTDLGLITSRKEGLNVYYRSVPEKFSAYLAYLQSLNRK